MKQRMTECKAGVVLVLASLATHLHFAHVMLSCCQPAVLAMLQKAPVTAHLA